MEPATRRVIWVAVTDRPDVQDAIAEGDRVVLRVISRGGHTGEFMGSRRS